MNRLINWLTNKFLQLEDYVKGLSHLREEANKAQERAEKNFLERINNDY